MKRSYSMLEHESSLAVPTDSSHNSSSGGSVCFNPLLGNAAPNPTGERMSQVPALKRHHHGNDTSYAFEEYFLPNITNMAELPLEPSYTTTPSTHNNLSPVEIKDQLPPLVTPAHQSPLLFSSYDELTTSPPEPGSFSGQKRHLHTRAGDQFEFKMGLPLVFLFFGTGGDQHIREFEVQANCFGCDANIFVVTVGEITNSNYLFPLINDHDGSLTRAFKAVHPLGGGRMPVDAVAVLDPLLRLRYFSPVGSFSNSPLAGRIADVLHTTVLCIGYLNNEP